MYANLLSHLLSHLQRDDANWAKFKDLFREMRIEAKSILLSEGEIAQYIYFIKKGCLHYGSIITERYNFPILF
jgi:hypothetical protein